MSSYRLVIFDLDGTLTQEQNVFTRLIGGFDIDIKTFDKEWREGRLSDHAWGIQIMRALADKGATCNEIREVLEEIPHIEGIGETVQALRKQGIRSVILTAGIDDLAGMMIMKYGFDKAIANQTFYGPKGNLLPNYRCRVPLFGKAESAEKYIWSWYGITPAETVMVGDAFVDTPVMLKAGKSFIEAYFWPVANIMKCD